MQSSVVAGLLAVGAHEMQWYQGLTVLCPDSKLRCTLRQVHPMPSAMLSRLMEN